MSMKDRLAALKAATKTDSKTAQVAISVPKFRTAEDKVIIQPLPVSVLAGKAFPATKTTFYTDDPKLSAKFELLSKHLGAESKLESKFSTVWYDIHKDLGANPDAVAVLSTDAVRLYLLAAKRMVADPTGSRAVERIEKQVKDNAADDLLALVNGGQDDGDGFM